MDGKSWGVNSSGGLSGHGSSLEFTKGYRQILTNFFKEKNIKTIVDAGCGDWHFMNSLNLEGINYKCIDISDYIIKRNKKLFGHLKNIEFIVGNIIEDLPPADLIIVKDVLQHLPRHSIYRFFEII